MALKPFRSSRVAATVPLLAIKNLTIQEIKLNDGASNPELGALFEPITR
jgi:hypothetical protein